MKVMLDTNVIASAILFPGETINRLMYSIFNDHELYLSSYVLDELNEVMKRKFPAKFDSYENFLRKLSYYHVVTQTFPEPALFHIRDSKDYPVLYSAITADIDILITGDKDFADIDIDKPRILTPREFLEQYC